MILSLLRLGQLTGTRPEAAGKGSEIEETYRQTEGGSTLTDAAERLYAVRYMHAVKLERDAIAPT